MSLLTPTHLAPGALPQQPGERRAWLGLHGSADSYHAVLATQAQDGLVLVACTDAAAAASIVQALRFYAGDSLPVLQFPAWETLPYDAFSPHQDIISERLATLQRLPRLKRGLLVAPAATLMQRLPPTSFIDGQVLSLRVGDRFDLLAQRQRLEEAGYLSVETVMHRGEFAIRGALLDFHPMGARHPLRVELLDDEIDTLRTFDAETQRTLKRVSRIEALPAREFPLDAAAITRFRNNWHSEFRSHTGASPVYQEISQGIASNGAEHYLPLFFDRAAGLASLFDYLPPGALVIQQAGLKTAVSDFWAQLHSRYQSLGSDVERPILAPDAIYLPPEHLNQALKSHPRVLLNDAAYRHSVQFASRPLPPLQANPRLNTPGQALIDLVRAEPGVRILFTAERAGRLALLSEFLDKAGIKATDCASWQAFLEGDQRFAITEATLDAGLWLGNCLVVSEQQLFSAPPGSRSSRQRRQARGLNAEQILRNLAELSPGAPVVHEEHGVGRYCGLETLDIDNAASEYLVLEYAEGARLYVPVMDLHLVTRYAGAEAESAPLHRLGSGQWDKARRKAAEKVVDVAAELLDVQARRAARKAPALRIDNADQERFAAAFPFELTADQASAIDAVLADIGSEKSTDRLICGDVGFGKTEVAMRAAFVAVQAGYQVAVLAPTTLLAQQHFDTFRDRFAGWPINLDLASRLRSGNEMKQVGQRLSDGRIDILIGTHRLLGADLAFCKLGLAIIDEEHRFGVRQKERLKALRAEVDVITLTATPIPRTLNLAFSGIRDLSIIATPPARRLSILTFVQERQDALIREAVQRELMRGGQVFLVHNQVQTILRAADETARLVPQARVGVGHGQMPKRALEAAMRDFHQRRTNVLVCTTIIENGIDIANANTIIIERADRFGLAQLHQLRGRVGRSHRQAYAYLLTPHASAITADAKKRLAAIQAAGELGVGFALATQDMEIRGAGELLGQEQSGQIESIGFNLYANMLDRAVNALRDGRRPELAVPLQTTGREVNLHGPALIPETWIPDAQTRLTLYKRIAAAPDQAALDDLRDEIIDRYGRAPAALDHLFDVTAVKLRTGQLGITRLNLGESGGRLLFDSHSRVDPAALVALVSREPQAYKLADGEALHINRPMPDLAARVRYAHELLDALEAPVSAAGLAAG